MSELTHQIEIRPPFFDVDALEVVWHGNYVKYFELARSALLHKYNYDYYQMRESGFAWPVVDMRLKFVRAASLHQVLKVRATIVEYEFRLKLEYEITDESGKAVTRGHTVQVAVDMKTQEMQYVCPKVLWERLGVRT